MMHPTISTAAQGEQGRAADALLLVGDLGGSTVDLAVISARAGVQAPLAAASYSSSAYRSFASLVQEFLTQAGLPVRHACFDVPGPVADGRATLTNLPWLLDANVLASTLHLTSVRLLNDLEALAYAVPHLGPEDVVTLNPGIPVPQGTMAVISVGAGLGAAYASWTGSGYAACASEGGHTDFAPTDDLQIDLLRYLLDRFDHVSYERVCSSDGIATLYDFLSQRGGSLIDGPEVITALVTAEDRAAVILDAALDAGGKNPLCAATINLFLAILGAEAANLALTVLSSGGVYIGGTIPARAQSLLRGGAFQQAFQRKGRLAQRLGRMPVHVIVSEQATLLGTAYYGLAQNSDETTPG